MRILTAFVVVTWLGAISAVAAQDLAPSTYVITGVTKQASGAVLPGVTVEAINATTGLIRSTVTRGDGRYRLEVSQPGRFTLRFQLPGFRTLTRDIDVAAGSAETTVDVVLQLGRVPPLTNTVPPGKKVVCGMTLIPADPAVDPGFILPHSDAGTAKGTMRVVPPPVCGSQDDNDRPAEPPPPPPSPVAPVMNLR